MAKDNRILLIANQGFMINSIKAELVNHALEIIHVKPSVTDIENLEDKPNVYVLYIEELDTILDVIVYLKDRIVEDKAAVNVIGNHDDLDRLYLTIPKDRLAGVFMRPVNVKDMAVSIVDVIKDEENRLAKKKILIVDDDGTMLRTIESWLSNKYQVFMVNSGMAAITFLAKKEVDLILLDYEMPVTSGPQVLEMLKSESATQSIPVMFLTNKSDKESVMNVLSLKPEKYLLKTLTRDELIANIDDFFERRKATNY
ncbi:MAG: response regulator [Pseudobutyrivibrio ruminis]|nr:response regulator [Pseudobutyrivibrio ruminis]